MYDYAFMFLVFLWFVRYQLDLFVRIQAIIHHLLASNCRNVVLQIEPQLVSGKNVMIAAHGNSLRSIIMYLDKLTSQEVIK